MLKIRLIAYRSLCLIFLLVCISCSRLSEMTPEQTPTPDPALVDRSWLTGTPCSAPCWYGLEPSKSSMEEAITTTAKLSFISPDALEPVTTSYWDDEAKKYLVEKVVYYRCKNPSALTCVYQSFREGILNQILLYPNYEITFSEAVEQLGEPTAFTINRTNPEAKGCIVSIVWEERQMFMIFDEGRLSSSYTEDLCDKINKENNKIPGNLSVQSVIIVNSALINELKKQSGYIPWNGFTNEK